jgi:hypothetical protein
VILSTVYDLILSTDVSPLFTEEISDMPWHAILKEITLGLNTMGVGV